MACEVRLLGRRGAAFGFIVCLQTLAWACGPRATAMAATQEPAAPAPDAIDECALVAEPGEPVATVALTDRVDAANAPRPSNDGERLLFRQLYETLVRADCRGRIVPGLAASWQLDAAGRAWTITLRDDARFSDGTPVTAADVRANWTREGSDELRPQVSRLVQEATPAGERTLSIALRSRRADAPLALAHPDLAIAKAVPGSLWPLGTRSSRVAPGATAGAITIARDPLPAIRFVVSRGDPRDLVDQGVDLLLTRDRAVLVYAGTLPQFQSVPLAWQRTHVLLTPGRSRSAPTLSDDQREALAADAVRGEARGALPPYWWQATPDCDIATAPVGTPTPPTPRVVYDANDATARDLAERLVGLARGSSPAATAFLDALLPDRPRRSYQRATALTGAALVTAVRAGGDAGYVMAVDARPVDACRELQILRERARWLDPETIVPLVETRQRAVLRRGRGGVTVDWDGGLLIR
jgi:hypothetical protein